MAKSFHYLPSEQMRFGLVPDGELVHAKIDGHIMLNTELPSKHRLQSQGGTSSRECQNTLYYVILEMQNPSTVPHTAPSWRTVPTQTSGS